MEYIFEEGIEALVPIYGENGENETKIYTLSGQTRVIDKKLDTVLRSYIDTWQKNIKSVKAYSQSKLNHKNLVPLVLSEQVVLIPIKVRKAVSFADGSYGYFLVSQIEDIKDEEEGAVLSLQSGTKITTTMKKKPINNKILEANYIRELYEKKMLEIKKQYAIGKKLSKLTEKTDLMEEAALFQLLLQSNR